MLKILNSIIHPYKDIHYSTWILMFAIFIDALGHIVNIFMPLYLHNLNFSLKLVGLLISIYGGGGIIGAYAGGYLSDKIEPSTVLISSLIVNSIFLIFFTVTQEINFLFIIIFLLGIFQHIFRPASIYILSKSNNPNNLTKLLGLRRVMVNFGIFIAGILGGMIADINYLNIFFFDACISCFTALGLLVVRKILILNMERCSIIQNKIELSKQTTFSLKFLFYIFILFINSCVFFQLNSTFPLYLKTYYQISIKDYSYIYSLSCFIVIFFEVPILTYTKKFNPILLSAFGALFCGGSLAFLPLGNKINFVYLIIVCLTIGEILFFPIMLNLIISLSQDKLGKIIGIQQSAYILGKFFGPLVGTCLLQIKHGQFLWYCCGLIGVSSYIILIYSKKIIPK